MDQNSKAKDAAAAQSLSPEEDSTLLAIEALEARDIDPNPRAFNAPRDIPVPPRAAPQAQAPKVIEPITPAPTPAPVEKPVIHKTVVIEPPKPVAKPTPVEVKPQPKAPEPAPAPVVVTPPKPKKPATPSEEMAEELAHAPSTSGFQFFLHQKAPRRPFVIVAVIVVLIGIGAAAFFATR